MIKKHECCPSWIFHLFKEAVTLNIVFCYCNAGQPVNRTNVTVGTVTFSNSMASLSLYISTLTTIHADTYTCRATLDDEETTTMLQQGINITFTRQ